MSERKGDDPNELKTSGAATPADPTTRPPDPEPPALAPEHGRLWKGFLEELKNHDDWESEFTPSPYQPGEALRAFIEAAGGAAGWTLAEAASADDSSLRYWGRAGLKWLEEGAEAEAASALEAHLWEATGGEPGSDLHPAVALEAADPARARAAGAHIGSMRHTSRWGRPVNIRTAPWTKKGRPSNLCSARNAMFPRRNGSLRS